MIPDSGFFGPPCIFSFVFAKICNDVEGITDLDKLFHSVLVCFTSQLLELISLLQVLITKILLGLNCDYLRITHILCHVVQLHFFNPVVGNGIWRTYAGNGREGGGVNYRIAYLLL